MDKRIKAYYIEKIGLNTSHKRDHCFTTSEPPDVSMELITQSPL